MEDIDKHVPKQLKPYLWKKGVSGNPNGRPKGKTLKEFAREYLETLPDDEKVDYLASLPTEIVWKMAEGNPESKIDAKIKTNNTQFTEEQLAEAQKILEQRISNTTPQTSGEETVE